jgi:hypothetical protein
MPQRVQRPKRTDLAHAGPPTATRGFTLPPVRASAGRHSRLRQEPLRVQAGKGVVVREEGEEGDDEIRARQSGHARLPSTVRRRRPVDPCRGRDIGRDRSVQLRRRSTEDVDRIGTRDEGGVRVRGLRLRFRRVHRTVSHEEGTRDDPPERGGGDRVRYGEKIQVPRSWGTIPTSRARILLPHGGRSRRALSRMNAIRAYPVFL